MSQSVPPISANSAGNLENSQNVELEEAKIKAREIAINGVVMAAMKSLMTGIVSHGQKPFAEQAAALRPADKLKAFNEMNDELKGLAMKLTPCVLETLKGPFQAFLGPLVVLQQKTDQNFLTQAIFCALQPELQPLRTRLDEILAAPTVEALG